MTVRNIMAMLAILGLGACDLGGLTEPPGSSENEPLPTDVTAQEAKALFDSNVAPIMEQKCAGAGCHTGTATFPPPFLGTGPVAEYYPTLSVDTVVTGEFRAASATLLTKLAGAPHRGQSYSDAEVARITEWLSAELAVRNPGEVPAELPVASTSQVLAKWSGCMSLDDWNETNMGSWANKDAEGNNNCQACHGNGLARFNTNPDNATMFEANRYELFIGSFFAIKTNIPTGQPEVFPAIEKLISMGDGSPGNLHPRYEVEENDRYFQRLQDFYDRTKAKFDDPAGAGCGPAELPAGSPPL